jgi:hypothetical protein
LLESPDPMVKCLVVTIGMVSGGGLKWGTS